MTRAVAYRGPDGYGHKLLPLSDGMLAGLGHRRLSIIDLAGGTQPMASHDSRFTIVFNGEIYNYLELREELLEKNAAFHSRSETEVILEAWRAWGESCLTGFRGMFAFALHDDTEETVVLARDPFGKKPLYVAEKGGVGGARLVFGSEIRAVLRHSEIPAELDADLIYEYLTWRLCSGAKYLLQEDSQVAAQYI